MVALAILSLVLTFALSLGVMYLSTAMFYPLLMMVLVSTYLSSRVNRSFYMDTFNPMSFITIIIYIRIIIPYIMHVNFGVTFYYPGFPFDASKTYHELWKQGFGMAACSASMMYLGWLIASVVHPMKAIQEGEHRVVNPFSRITGLVSRGVTFLSLLALVYFFAAGYSNPLEVLLGGGARSAGAPEGFGIFIWMGNAFMILGSVLWSSYLIHQNPHDKLYRLIYPTFIAFLLLLPAGGRVNAISPILMALLVVWYRRHDVGFRGKSLLSIMVRRWYLVVPGIVLFFLFSTFLVVYRGGLYRGGGFAAAIAGVMNGDVFGEHVQGSGAQELSALFPYMMAVMLGPNAMEGKGWAGFFGYFVSRAGYETYEYRTGTFMVKELLFVPDERLWGFHSGLFIDVFLTSNLILACFLTFAYGYAYRQIYVKTCIRRTNELQLSLYVVMTWMMFWMYFESMTVITIMYFYIPAFVGIRLLARVAKGRQIGPDGALSPS